jgi:hypothetical protein
MCLPYSASTQLSLVPPPCDELTTSEPFFSATRQPPGVILMPSGLTSTKGAGPHGAGQPRW